MLTGIMLCIFILLISAAVALKISDLSHSSYILSFAAACVCAGGLLFLIKRRPLRHTIKPFPAFLHLTMLCLGVNTLWALFVKIEPTVDFLTFWNTAVNLAEGKLLTNTMYLGLFPHILGYSSFLSAFLRVFGSSVAVAVGVNIVLTAMSGMVIFLLCLRWRDTETAVIAYFLWSFCPSKMIYNSMVLSEPLYTFLLLLFLLLLSECEKREDRRGVVFFALSGILGGAVLAFTNAVRPVGAIVLIAVILWRLIIAGRRAYEKEQLRRWGIFLAALLAIYAISGGLWNAHIARLLGEKPASFPAYNLYVGFNMDTLGSYADEDMDALISYRQEEGSAVAAQKRILNDFKARLSSGEVEYAKLFSAKLRTFIGNDEGGAYYAQEQISPLLYKLCAYASNIYYYFIAVFAVFGAVTMLKRKEGGCMNMVPLYVIGLTLAHLLVEVAGRYHYSVIPMLTILAAFSIGSFFRRAE